MKQSKFIPVQPENGDMRITLNSHFTTNQYPRHFHEFHELLFIIHGQGHVEIESVYLDILPDSIMAIAHGEDHQIIDEEQNLITRYSLWFRETKSDSLLEMICREIFQQSPRNRMFSTASIPLLNSRSLLRSLLQIQKNNLYPGSAIYTRHYLHEILLGLYEKITAAPPIPAGKNNCQFPIAAVLHYCEQNYYRKIPLGEISAATQFSVRRFTSYFREAVGMSFTGYLIHLRIQHAQKMLADGKEIAATCFECGFDELSYFYRVFKKLTGITPGEFISRKV